MFVRIVILLCAVTALTANASGVTMSWSPVGNPGNANDPATGNVFGGVDYNYNIGKYDVTTTQYVEFLNAKDATGANTLFLYNIGMVRPERFATRERGESCCIRLAGESPVAVSAGAPRSRFEARSENFLAEAECRKPSGGRQVSARGASSRAQHQVNLAAS